MQSGTAAIDLFEAKALISRFSTDFEAGLYPIEDAKKIVLACLQIKRCVQSIEYRAANRAVNGNAPGSKTQRSDAEWLARNSGSSVGKANADLKAARNIAKHPDISDAFKQGRISDVQAKEAAEAANADPSAAKKLVETAENGTRSEFQRECLKTKAASNSKEDEIARHERMRKARFCRVYTDQEGFSCMIAKMTPDAMAIISAALEPHRKAAFEAARKSGEHESQGAYLADALVALANDSGGSGPKHTILIRTEASALLRGHKEGDEVCEIPGLDAPVSVEVVRNLLSDSILHLLITDGEDIRTVCSNSRSVKRAIEIALLERDRRCVVPGCDLKQPLERHHWITDYKDLHKTDLEGLARVCPHHHDQLTHGGSRLEGGPGRWKMVRAKAKDPRSRSTRGITAVATAATVATAIF